MATVMKPAPRDPLGFIIALIGAGGIVAQVLMLREFVVASGGNELVMGIVLANWLMLEALGAYLGGRLNREDLLLPGLGAALILFGCILIPTMIIITPFPRLAFGVLSAQEMGMWGLTMASSLLLAPSGLLHGATFPLAVQLISSAGIRGATGRAYLFETLGTLVGGVLITAGLWFRFDATQLAVILAASHVGVGSFLLRRAAPTRFRRMLFSLSIIAAVVCAIWSPRFAGDFRDLSLDLRWPGADGTTYIDTPYGNVTEVRYRGESTVYYDGSPLVTAPNPDLAMVQDFAHLGAASHPQPSRVLALAGGLGGMIHALLEHPVEELVYVDMDPGVPGFLAGMDCEVLAAEISDPRLRIENRDARLFLSRTENEYDLVILNFIDPSNISSNRLFTREFFELVRGVSADEGLLIYSLPGSPTEMAPQTLRLNASIYLSARAVFDSVEVIPGDRNIYLASSNTPAFDVETLANRLEVRDADPGFMSHSYLSHRLDPSRLGLMLENLTSVTVAPNEDLNPRALYYSMEHWGGVFSPGAASFLRRYEERGMVLYAAILGAFALALLLTSGEGGGLRRSMLFSIWTSGIAGMAFDILVLFVFQALYGFVYTMAGVLMAAFMAGLYLGARWGNEIVERNLGYPIFGFLEAKLCLTLPLLYYGAAYLGRADPPPGAIFAFLLIYGVVSGSGVGAQFPVAAAMLPTSGNEGTAAGSLYAADLLGGWLGGLTIAVVMFPLLGLRGTVWMLASLKAASLTVFILSSKAVKRLGGHSV